MNDNDYACYDPIFYFHHCNIDRILAFWEHIYPDYRMGQDGYFTAKDKPRGRFTQVDGTFFMTDEEAITEDTGLAPFRKDDGNYWTSKDAQSLKSDAFPKHYTYLGPDGVPIDKLDRRALQRHFGLNFVQIRQKADYTLKQPLFKNYEDKLPTGFEAVYNYRHFIIGVELDGNAFNGSYALEVIYTTKSLEELYVGSVAVLTRSQVANCEACAGRRQAGSRVHGIIPVPHNVIVTSVRENYPDDHSVSDADLVKTIKSNFRARFVLPGGDLYPFSNEGETLPDGFIPKLRLYSANVAAPEEEDDHEKEGPQGKEPKGVYEFYDWKDHESFLETNRLVIA